MGILTTTYKAKSLDDLANGIEEMADEKWDNLGGSGTKHTRFGTKQFTDGMKFAADIVRKTTIDSTMDDDDA